MLLTKGIDATEEDIIKSCWAAKELALTFYPVKYFDNKADEDLVFSFVYAPNTKLKEDGSAQEEGWTTPGKKVPGKWKKW